MRLAANDAAEACNARICSTFCWETEDINWVSPVADDAFAEYYDQAFLDRLGIEDLRVPLEDFWPASGPRWDGLARTASGKIILVEAKAYVEESVDYRSGAGPASMARIRQSLADAKHAFQANEAAPWEAPFYQYANRLAHLYFLRELNNIDAYLLFLNFADAPDVPAPCSTEQWAGATRITEKCLGLGKHPYRDYVKTMVWSVPEMISNFNQN
jgi:hypothetical protein